ncbi:MAG: YihY/virulence factor BrkB family protein [Clostridioides sp.]|nr:YihY/virulence factor BrkB family protein [Clostridioides sp.]
MSDLVQLIRRLVNKFNYGALSSRAAELAFFILLSIFPFILFFISGVAFIPEFHLNKYTGAIAGLMPASVFNIIYSIITSAMHNKNPNLLYTSFFLTIWTFSRSVKALIKGMNKAYNVEETRSFIKIMAISFLFTIALLVLIFSSIILLIYGEKIGFVIFGFIGLNRLFLTIWNILRYTVSILTIITIFIVLYKYTPNKKIRYRDALPGAVFATFGWFLVSYLYSIYTNHFANYEAIYGSIAEIIVLITWIYFSSWVLIIGYLINVRLCYRGGDGAGSFYLQGKDNAGRQYRKLK